MNPTQIPTPGQDRVQYEIPQKEEDMSWASIFIALIFVVILMVFVFFSGTWYANSTRTSLPCVNTINK